MASEEPNPPSTEAGEETAAPAEADSSGTQGDPPPVVDGEQPPAEESNPPSTEAGEGTTAPAEADSSGTQGDPPTVADGEHDGILKGSYRKLCPRARFVLFLYILNVVAGANVRQLSLSRPTTAYSRIYTGVRWHEFCPRG